ncbi:MAG: putative aminohydrolase SsnA [Rhodothermales bacterium]|nr:putative aminohydrolase SsnA [Rhodothermales bacterium]
MTEPQLLHNGLVVAAYSDEGATRPSVIPDGAVVWNGERITAVGTRVQLEQDYPNAQRVDAHGGLIAPGLINLHHHFYSALARGLDPGTPMRNFPEVLDRLWWRLDRALNLETVKLSAQLSLADCVRWGCTTVFDHHASPNAIEGSLEAIGDATEESGLSAVLCYEVTDRNGHDQALAGLEENLRFIEAHATHSRIRGVVGLHASFTLRDDTLSAVAEQRPKGVGCHIHVAEDPVDVKATKAAFGIAPVERLARFGLLDRNSLLAHGIHLSGDEYRTIAQHDAILIHNPESNANNSVGHLDTVRTARHGGLIGLGTDGMSSAVLRALRSAFLIHRQISGDCASGFDVLPELLHNNVLAARRFFDEPLLGELAAGAPADIIVLDAPAPTRLGSDNVFAHIVYGASESPVRHTVARGKVLLKDFRHTEVNPVALAERARDLTPAMWARFADLKWGTKYLGE